MTQYKKIIQKLEAIMAEEDSKAKNAKEANDNNEFLIHDSKAFAYGMAIRIVQGND